MRFAFTGDQQLFAEGLRDLLAKECTPAHVRAAWESGSGHDPELWAHLGEVLPQRDVVAGAVVPRGAHVRGRALLGEEIAQTLGEELLVVGEREAHHAPRGSWRTRSAMMLRWISLVPA